MQLHFSASKNKLSHTFLNLSSCHSTNRSEGNTFSLYYFHKATMTSKVSLERQGQQLIWWTLLNTLQKSKEKQDLFKYFTPKDLGLNFAPIEVNREIPN